MKIILSSILLVCLLVTGCGDGEKVDFPVSELVISGKSHAPAGITAEIATTPAQREQGLMHRRYLLDNYGMLFVWPWEQEVSMWMKNTYIPLDILFIRDSKVVHIVTNTVPHSLTLIPSQQVVDRALELNAGTVARLGLRVGDYIGTVSK